MKAIILDFDGTLAYFTNGSKDFFSIFTKRGIEEDVLNKCYEEVRMELGFSIQNFSNKISDKVGIDLDTEAIEKEFKEWLKLNLILYSDSINTIKNWQKQNIPVIILTAGEEIYQRQKIDITQIPYDELIIVSTAKEKIVEIQRLAKKYGKPIAIFDNKADVLDTIKEDFPNSSDIYTILVRRLNSNLKEQEAKYRHTEIRNFNNVIFR